MCVSVVAFFPFCFFFKNRFLHGFLFFYCFCFVALKKMVCLSVSLILCHSDLQLDPFFCLL